MSEPNLTPAFARHRRRRARSINRTPRCGPLCRIRVDQQPPNLLRQLIRRPIQPVDVDEDLVRASIPQAHLEALRSTPVVCCPVEPETSRKFVVMDGRQNQTTRRSSRRFPRVVLRNSLDLTLVCSRLKDERAIHRHLDAPLPLDAARPSRLRGSGGPPCDFAQVWSEGRALLAAGDRRRHQRDAGYRTDGCAYPEQRGPRWLLRRTTMRCRDRAAVNGVRGVAAASPRCRDDTVILRYRCDGPTHRSPSSHLSTPVCPGVASRPGRALAAGPILLTSRPGR